MDIRFQDNGGSLIANEVIDGVSYGKFFLNSDGEVWHRWQATQRYVNRDRRSFEASVSAWRRYQKEVVEQTGDQDQLGVVSQLRQKLGDDPTCLEHAESFWAVVIEQAQAGML